MRISTKTLRELLPLLGFAILPLVLFWNVTLGGQTMLPVDALFQWEPWKSSAAALGVGQPDNGLLLDLMIQNYVWKDFIRESLAMRELPLWNPYLFAGAPFLATGQNAAFYPFSFFFLVMPLTQAYGWYTVSQLWLAGFCMYLFGRILRMQPGSAFITGLIFQGCGFMVVSAAVFPMIIGAALWLPLLLACLEKIINITTHRRGAGKTLPWAALGAFILGVQILAGHIEITYYTLLVMAFFALWRLWGRLWRMHKLRGRTLLKYALRPSGWLLATVLTGLILGAIQFVPFLEVGTSNFREGSASFAQVLDWGFKPRRVLTFAMPDFYGNPAHHSYTDVLTGEEIPLTTNLFGDVNPRGPGTSSWGLKNYVEGGIYLGILPLLLAALGLFYGLWPKDPNAPPDLSLGRGRRRSVSGFMLVLAFFSLAFIFGTPLYAILYYGFPGLNQLHSPFRWVFPLSVAVATLAGYGSDFILSRAYVRFGQRRLGLLAGGVLASGLFGLLALFGMRWGYASLEPIFERVFMGLAGAPQAFPSTRAFVSYQWQNGLIFAGMLTLAGVGLLAGFNGRLSSAVRRTPSLILLFAAIIIVDLSLIGAGFNASTDPAWLNFKPELVQWLAAQPDRDTWRITSFDNKGTKPFNANSAWLTGFQDIRGYDSIIARQYVDYMRAIEPQNELQFNRIQPLGSWEAIQSPLLDLLTVKYIITEETLDLPKLALAWEGENLRVYENLAVMPRAYTLPFDSTVITDGDAYAAMQARDPRFHAIFDPTAGDAGLFELAPPADGIQSGTPRPATISFYEGRTVFVDVQLEEPGWLILNDSYAPGWNAFVRPFGGTEDDEEQSLVRRVNGNFRAVPLEAGAWTVRFRYSPTNFLVGGLLSVMGGIVILFAFTVWGWRRYYRPRGELTNTLSIAKNSVAPMALNLFNRFIDFLFAAFYLRLLGPADSGAYAVAITIAGLFEIISNFGLNAFLIREVSQDRKRASRFLLNTSVLRLFTGGVGSLPFLLYLWGTDYGVETLTAVGFLMVGMVLSGAASGLTGLFYAFEEAEIPASVTTVTTILKVGFGVLVLLMGFGFVGLAAVSIFVNFVTLAILAAAAFQRYPLRGPWRVDFGMQREMLRLSYPLMINHLLATIYWQIDVLILREFNGEEVVGWYNSAYKYINAFNVIPSFFTFALFPIISKQIQADLEAARRTFRMSVKILTLVSLPLAIFVTLLAPLMIQLLGGEEFIPQGHIALRVVIWSIPFGWINSVTNYTLIALGQERIQTRAFVLGVSFNILGNLVLILGFNLSFVGAGLATIASEIVLLGLFNLYLRQKMPAVNWIGLLWRPTGVALATLAAMLLASQINLWLGVAVGLLLYPLGLWLLRVFGEEERFILRQILPERILRLMRNEQ